MKKMAIFLGWLLVIIFPLFAQNENVAKPLSVVIVGAGPAGLATAIEAHQCGAQVTLVEKRKSYTREQTLFLQESSLKLLEKWSVRVPQMVVKKFEEGQRVGFVPIRHLEEGLENRLGELGIHKLHGEFKEFTKDGRELVVLTESGSIDIPYHLVVAADGTYSGVRDHVGIQCHFLGTAIGAVAIVPLPMSKQGDSSISPPIKKKDYFIRKMTVPPVSIVFIQNFPHSSGVVEKNPLNKKLTDAAFDCDWQTEAELMGEGKAIVFDDIQVILCQARTFSDEERSVILVGDAAASASFFQGMGANTALKTAGLAGEFFKKIHAQDKNAYCSFNQKMKETTDELINDSRYLFFSHEPIPRF